MAAGLTLAALLAVQAHAGRVFPSIGSRAPAVEPARDASLPTDSQLTSQGVRIGEVHIKSRDLFDQDARDDDTAFSRLANHLHIATREATIEDQLLFRSGDLYQPGLLAESARILRDTRYLRDAAIRPVAFHDGVVDVEVTTQDVWTFTPSVVFGRSGGANHSGFEVEELNLFGTGTQLGVGFKSDVDRDSKFIHYHDRQLGSSWWDLSAEYADNSDGRFARLGLERPFYALDTRWAAGVSLLDDQRVDSRYDLGEIVDRFATRERRATIYFGGSGGLVDGWARRISAGLTIDEHSFQAVPGVDATQLLPSDRRLVYPWVGAEWVQDSFRTARNRDQIEKTEDYSLGWRASARLGFASAQFGSDRDAAMLSARLSKGLTFGERQTLQFALAADTRVESGSLMGGLLEAESRYYFRQSQRRLFFLNLSASAGTDLDVDQQLLLGGDNGLRGYPLRYQAGTGRWLLTAEQRIFTDWYPLQLFNVGGAVFYDMGSTWGRDPLGTPSRGLLRDVGFGLRLGNARSALGNVLHLDVAFPLDRDPSMKGVQFLVQTRKSF
ncbi:MAG TPA: BamA/TamA family outer membrane protein [Steroidobacteraceae bacterium]|nr:BamA/TamA family outer membrane protein [Steroidobacteraceae bacterium]